MDDYKYDLTNTHKKSNYKKNKVNKNDYKIFNNIVRGTVKVSKVVGTFLIVLIALELNSEDKKEIDYKHDVMKERLTQILSEYENIESKEFNENVVEGRIIDNEESNETMSKTHDEKLSEKYIYNLTAKELSEEVYGNIWSDNLEEYRTKVNQKYKDNDIIISGDIIRKNDKYDYIVLDNESKKFGNLYNVKCYVDDAEQYDIGDTVKLKGTYDGMDNIGFDIYIEDCKAIKK